MRACHAALPGSIPGQDLIWNKNPNTLFPNLSPFPSYANITRICPHLIPRKYVAKFCSQRFVFSPSLLAPTSSKGWLEQMLKMSPSRTNTCFKTPSDISLHITQTTLGYLHCSCVNLCKELLPACHVRFVHFLLHTAT